MEHNENRSFAAGEPGHFEVSGWVRQPPPLRSVVRLQKTIGNRAAQALLGIDARRPEAGAPPGGPAPEHE